MKQTTNEKIIVQVYKKHKGIYGVSRSWSCDKLRPTPSEIEGEQERQAKKMGMKCTPYKPGAREKGPMFYYKTRCEWGHEDILRTLKENGLSGDVIICEMGYFNEYTI